MEEGVEGTGCGVVRRWEGVGCWVGSVMWWKMWCIGRRGILGDVHFIMDVNGTQRTPQSAEPRLVICPDFDKRSKH